MADLQNTPQPQDPNLSGINAPQQAGPQLRDSFWLSIDLPESMFSSKKTSVGQLFVLRSDPDPSDKPFRTVVVESRDSNLSFRAAIETCLKALDPNAPLHLNDPQFAPHGFAIAQHAGRTDKFDLSDNLARTKFEALLTNQVDIGFLRVDYRNGLGMSLMRIDDPKGIEITIAMDFPEQFNAKSIQWIMDKTTAIQDLINFSDPKAIEMELSSILNPQVP